MIMIADVAVGVVALLHVYFLVLEMFLWDRPFGLKTFGMTPEKAAATNTLAMNQGLYNGFRAAGLAWGLLWSGPFAPAIKIFFLVCVVMAGTFASITASVKIRRMQAVRAPA